MTQNAKKLLKKKPIKTSKKLRFSKKLTSLSYSTAKFWEKQHLWSRKQDDPRCKKTNQQKHKKSKYFPEN